MIREEAIHILDNLKPTNIKSSFDAYVVGEAITMAIKALQAQADGDLISRQAVQNYIAHFLSLYLQDNVREAVEAIDEVIGDMPSVAIPTAEIKPCTAEYQKVYMKGWNDGRKKMLEAMEREIAY